MICARRPSAPPAAHPEPARPMTDVTQLLHQAAAGDMAARDHLYAALYPELMRIARAHVARAGTVSLAPPALLHEAYLRVAARGATDLANRRVFFAYASTVMRNVIIDYVRERRAQKRGGGASMITLHTGIADEAIAEESIEGLADALAALEKIDPRSHRVVEMRYFGGLTEEEIAASLAVSVPTVKRDWRKARAFLFDALRQ
jgi:RNA polymerase sigma factor (TIGR02999 family)